MIVHKFFGIFLFVIFFQMESNIVFGTNFDKDNLNSTSSNKRGEVDYPNISPHLKPSPELISAAQEKSDIPLQYDEEDDVYYRKRTLPLNSHKNKAKDEKESPSLSGNLKGKTQTNKILTNNTSKQSLVEHSKLTLYKEETTFDLARWKKETLKLTGKGKLSEELHRASEITIDKEMSIPPKTKKPYNGSKICGYKGWSLFAPCANLVEYTGEISFEVAEKYPYKETVHTCLCSEIEQLYQALLKEQQKNQDLMEAYNELCKQKKIKNFISQFALPKDRATFDLARWKKETLKLTGEGKLGEELHRASEITTTKELSIPYKVKKSCDSSKICGHTWGLISCPNVIKHKEDIISEEIEKYPYKEATHRCLCSEIEQLYHALLKEQQKNQDLIRKYNGLYGKYTDIYKKK